MALVTLRWLAAGVTDTGLRRDHNEDTLVLDQTEGLVIVADGMGGRPGGEHASAQAAQIEHVKQVRAQRDQTQVDAILARIEAAARTPDAPLMPLFVEAVEAYATLGEITDVLRKVFGEYRPPIVV